MCLSQIKSEYITAPLAAKTLAALDVATGERLAPRTLRAFLIHNATMPAPLASPRLRDVTPQFVGFGRPSSATAMLETEDHAITMVFESRLTAGEQKPAILRFDFQWPAALPQLHRARVESQKETGLPQSFERHQRICEGMLALLALYRALFAILWIQVSRDGD